LADDDRMVEHYRNLARSGTGIPRHAQLRQRRADVEVGPFANHLDALEEEDDDQAEVNFPTGGRQAAPISEMGAGEPALHDHRVGGVVEGLRMELEVRKPLLVLLEKGIDPGMAVPDLAGSDYLVTRIAECGDAAVEVVRVLSLHVLADCCFAPEADIAADKHRVSMPRAASDLGRSRSGARRRPFELRLSCRAPWSSPDTALSTTKQR